MGQGAPQTCRVQGSCFARGAFACSSPDTLRSVLWIWGGAIFLPSSLGEQGDRPGGRAAQRPSRDASARRGQALKRRPKTTDAKMHGSAAPTLKEWSVPEAHSRSSPGRCSRP